MFFTIIDRANCSKVSSLDSDFELLCNDLLPASDKKSPFTYTFIAGLDFYWSLILGIAGFVRLPSVLLLMKQDCKKLFWARHEDPFFYDDMSNESR